MGIFLLLTSVVLMACILMHRIAAKLPIPSLLLFIALGMCFGENGFLKIPFDNYALSETICSVCLVFIMFYGGFGTNVQTAKPVLFRSFLLATVGVLLTAGLVGIFVHFVFALNWMQSLLIGAVISSTDAASVFNVLRAQKLSLKQNTDSLLELESGSNDPVSYMLTILMITILQGKEIFVLGMLAQQITIGVVCGFLIGKLGAWILIHGKFHMAQGKTIFLFAVALLGYALPVVCGGNGYLSAYLCGIFLGNHAIPDKKDMVKFFDILTETAQMVIFFLLGLLVTPLALPAVFLPAAGICLFLTWVARPLAVFALLKPFGASWQQIVVVSWAGLRGVASIVFSIYVILNEITLPYHLFNLVFVIVLLSLAIQGTLLPMVCKKCNFIDTQSNVLRTFNDYQEAGRVSFIKVKVGKGHPFIGRTVQEIGMIPELLITLLLRGQETILPRGNTKIAEGDLLVLAASAFEDRDNMTLREICLEKGHKWSYKQIKEIAKDKKMLIIMIQREGQTYIPNGDMQVYPQDTLVIAES